VEGGEGKEKEKSEEEWGGDFVKRAFEKNLWEIQNQR
jgi:hypothetical protein